MEEATGTKAMRDAAALRRSIWLVQGPQENIIEWGEIRGVGRSLTIFVNSLDLFPGLVRATGTVLSRGVILNLI